MASWYSGPTLTREQMAQVLYQAGIRGGDLTFLVAVAERESGYVAGAHRSDRDRSAMSGDRGLLQINYIHDEGLRQAGIIQNPQDLFDPLTNARAAAWVLQRQGRAAWGVPGGNFGGASGRAGSLNISAAQAAVDRAAAQGMLGQDYAAPQNATPGAGAGAAGPMTLPRDARIIRTPFNVNVMFKIPGGVWMRYDATGIAGITPRESMSAEQFGTTFKGAVLAGSAEELAEIPTAFGTYAQYTNAILDQVFPKGDPRRDDPEIMKVLATRAGRPDMTEAEFENLLKGTRYYQSRTEGQLRWNDLSEAERQVQQKDMLSRMQQAYQQHVGGPPKGWTHTMADVVALASGKMGFGEWTETRLKPAALKNPESPWSRQVRAEKEDQRQRPIDIENTMSQIRNTLSQWGVKWSEGTLRSRAQAVVEKRMSDDDVLQSIKQSAQVLYPWKDPEMETVVAAAPWIETYNRVLERQGSLETPDIAKVLSAYGRDPDNNDVWSFEQKLKLSNAYDATRQGQDDAWSTVGELAGMMGFN